MKHHNHSSRVQTLCNNTGDYSFDAQMTDYETPRTFSPRRMIKGRDHRPVVSTSDIPELTESVYEQSSS